jgi:hypothetical protein
VGGEWRERRRRSKEQKQKRQNKKEEKKRRGIFNPGEKNQMKEKKFPNASFFFLCLLI